MISSLYHLSINCIINHIGLFDLSNVLPNFRQDLFDGASKSSQPLTDYLFQKLCPLEPESLNLVDWKISHLSIQFLFHRGARSLKQLRIDETTKAAFYFMRQCRPVCNFSGLKTLELDRVCLNIEVSEVLFSVFPHLKTLRILVDSNEGLRPLFSNDFLKSICPFLERVEICGIGKMSLEDIVFPKVHYLALQNLDCSSFYKFPEGLKYLSFDQTIISMRCFKEMLETCKELVSFTFVGGSASVEALNGLYRYGGAHIKNFRFDGIAPGQDGGALAEEYMQRFRTKWPTAFFTITFGSECGFTMTQEIIPTHDENQ